MYIYTTTYYSVPDIRRSSYSVPDWGPRSPRCSCWARERSASARRISGGTGATGDCTPACTAGRSARAWWKSLVPLAQRADAPGGSPRPRKKIRQLLCYPRRSFYYRRSTAVSVISTRQQGTPPSQPPARLPTSRLHKNIHTFWHNIPTMRANPRTTSAGSIEKKTFIRNNFIRNLDLRNQCLESRTNSFPPRSLHSSAVKST